MASLCQYRGLLFATSLAGGDSVAKAPPKRVPARVPGSPQRRGTALGGTMRASTEQRGTAVVTEPAPVRVHASSITAIDTKPSRRVGLRRPVAEMSRRQATTVAVSLLVAAAATVLAGHVGTGFDATWALVWARDLLHAHTASIPAH